MRFDYLRGDKLHCVELAELGEGRWRAKWSLREAGDGSPEGSEVLAERTIELEALPSGPAAYSVRVGHEVSELRIERNGASRTLVESGEAVTFEHRDPYSSGGPGAAGHAGGPVEIASPMPGRVVELTVAEGDRVEEGQTVVVVEAMKMANEYRAPIAGTVAAVRCAMGEAVEGGTVLLVLEPDEPEEG